MKTIFSIISFCLFYSCTEKKQLDTFSNSLEPIPTIDMVGQLALPDTIAPVVAPFEMPHFEAPSFRESTINIVERQAKESEMATNIIQSSIDELSKRGGGKVIIPKGNWKSGRISLKSNVNLHIAEGAVLNFSTDVKDYQPAVFNRVESIEVMSLGACIYANNQENIAITGKGKLIGPNSGEIKKRIYNKAIESLIDLSKPATERIHDGSKEDWILPPKFISPINCKNVLIEGVSLENTAFWNIVPTYCDHVIIRGVSVKSEGIPRGDGIDIESSKNVLIEYCTLSTGDDAFTMKSGRGGDGLKVNKPTENIVVRYCLARKGHGGVTCGSETAGTIRNLYVHDCVFDGTGVGIRFKTRRPRGGGGENLYYERIRMNLEATAIKWDMLGTRAYVGNLADRLPAREINELTPFYRNVSVSNIIIENSTFFMKVIGIPESPLTNLTIDNVNAKCSNLAIIHDADNVKISNTEIKTDNAILDILGGKNISFDNVLIKTNAKGFKMPNETIDTNNIQLMPLN